jgi:hypothetical protein
MQNLRILAYVVAALGSFTAGCGSDNDSDNNNNCVNDGDNDKDDNCVGTGSCAAVIRVENQSGFALKEVHVATVGGTVWGANLITGPLAAGTSITIAASGHHDVLLINAAGQQCTLHDVDLCANNADLIIAKDVCPGFTNTDP